MLEAIQEREGSLSLFASGYKRFGLIENPECMVYHEWAPGAVDAKMIGEFNNWNGTQMHRDQFGVWSCTIPSHSTSHPLMLNHLSRRQWQTSDITHVEVQDSVET